MSCKDKSDIPIVGFVVKDTLTYTSDFSLIIESVNKRINNRYEVTADEAVLLVKYYNSICSYSLLNQEPYKTFEKKFSDYSLNKIVKILNCGESIGMGYYCKDYDLVIGGIRYPNNSYIVILELQK